MSGHNHVWAQIKCVWAQSCLGTIVPGHNRVWAQSCLGTIVSGHNRVLAQSCLGTVVWAQSCGPNHVWAQTWWNRNQLTTSITPMPCYREGILHEYRKLMSEVGISKSQLSRIYIPIYTYYICNFFHLFLCFIHLHYKQIAAQPFS